MNHLDWEKKKDGNEKDIFLTKYKFEIDENYSLRYQQKLPAMVRIILILFLSEACLNNFSLSSTQQKYLMQTHFSSGKL